MLARDFNRSSNLQRNKVLRHDSVYQACTTDQNRSLPFLQRSWVWSMHSCDEKILQISKTYTLSYSQALSPTRLIDAHIGDEAALIHDFCFSTLKTTHTLPQHFDHHMLTWQQTATDKLVLEDQHSFASWSYTFHLPTKASKQAKIVHLRFSASWNTTLLSP